MSRIPNTDVNGKAFGQTTVGAVWDKGRKLSGYDLNVWRFDVCGNVIKNSAYGDVLSIYGWEVDHIKPVSKGGTDNLSNLQPLQCEANRAKGDTYPWS